MTKGLLSGTTVLDLTHAYAGPFCTHNLALLGADIIKVERPGGDDFRARPEVFSSINAGKRSVVLDLRDDAARASLQRLAADADVVIHNFRPDVPARLGVDWPTLSALNPRLVYVAISGYGEGPFQDRAAIEWAVQARSGLMHEFIGDRVEQTASWYPGISIVDPIAGYTAFTAVLAALLERQSTGAGQYLDISMMDAVLALMGQYVANAVLDGPPTYTLGVRLRTGEGLLYIAMSHHRWFESICDVLGVPGLVADARFATNEARTENYAALVAELERAAASRPAEHWETELGRVGVPASVVASWTDAAADPSVLARGLFRDVETPWGRGVINLGGFRLASQAGPDELDWSVPEVGAHTGEVLGRLRGSATP